MDSYPAVRAHDLLPGEHVLWSGRPEPGFRVQKSDRSNWVGGCFFTGFALFWTTMALVMTNAGGAPWFFRVVFPLFGLPFIGVGLMILFGAPFLRLSRGRHTAYAITERRLVTVIEKGSREVLSLDLERIKSTTLHEGPDGIGTVTFTISQRDMERLAQQGRLSGVLASLTIDSVADVVSVHATLESARTRRLAEVGEVDP